MGHSLPEVDIPDALIAACRTEGMEGLSDFYRIYAPAVLALCLARLGDRALAEDACHDAILKAYAAMGRFWPGARVWPWLSTIANNVCTDVQRRRQREIIAGLTPDGDSAFREPSADDAAQTRMYSNLVTEAIRSLPARQRELIYRYEYQGYSYQDIADLTGTSLPAVRTALMRARQALRARVEELTTGRSYWSLGLVPLIVRLPRQVRGWVTRAATRVRHATLTKPELAGHLAAVTALTMVAATGVGGLRAGASPHNNRVATAPGLVADRPALGLPVSGAGASGAPPSGPAGIAPPSGSGSGRTGGAARPPSGSEFHFQGPSFSTPSGGSPSSPSGISVGSIAINCDQVTQASPVAGTVCPILTNSSHLPPLSHH